MTEVTEGDRALRRARIERALADYPHIERERIDEVRHWFDKEASALDVAVLATNQDIAVAYRRFRADHIDTLTPKDYLRGVAFTAAIVVIIVLIVWRA
ncbi:MAG: hypothetical protein ABIQ81_09090 [Novosphingobium sp.]